MHPFVARPEPRALVAALAALALFAGCASTALPPNSAAAADAGDSGTLAADAAAQDAGGGDALAGPGDGGNADANAAADAAAGGDAEAADVASGPMPAAPVAFAGECPDLTAGGLVKITSGGFARTVYVSLPPDWSAPSALLFAWHGLGDNGNNFSKAFGTASLAKNNGAVVITPDNCCVKGLKCCSQVSGWSFLDATGGADAQLFDDLLSCATQQMNIDTSRVYSTGFSAGGLWTTWLILNRSEYLAAAAPFSGGIDGTIVSYLTPKHRLPVLGSFGGVDDQISMGININFHDMMLELFKDLRADKHFVVACDHGGGHTVPMEGPSYAAEFLFKHTFNDGTSPYAASGLSKKFPDYCSILP